MTPISLRSIVILSSHVRLGLVGLPEMCKKYLSKIKIPSLIFNMTGIGNIDGSLFLSDDQDWILDVIDNL